MRLSAESRYTRTWGRNNHWPDAPAPARSVLGTDNSERFNAKTQRRGVRIVSAVRRGIFVESPTNKCFKLRQERHMPAPTGLGKFIGIVRLQRFRSCGATADARGRGRCAATSETVFCGYGIKTRKCRPLRGLYSTSFTSTSRPLISSLCRMEERRYSWFSYLMVLLK